MLLYYSGHDLLNAFKKSSGGLRCAGPSRLLGVYPYCKACFSRIDTNPEDTRLTCSKCGYSCAKSLLEYRYRLSMRVARGSCMFGVTVFGNCLNPYFGISASGFQRLVVDKSGPLESSKSTLLVKAVEECFIGKHFIFGIKVTDNDIKPWVEATQVNSHMAQLIATQMILPKAAGLRGCTVLNYFEAALQRAAEPKQCTIVPKETAKLNGEPLWPIPHNSPTPVFSNDTLHSSGFLPLSLSRSQRLDSSLSPTPPWQQTLGLITSSAEQEESRKDDKKSLCFSEKCRRSATPLETWADLTPPTHKTAGLPTLQVNDISTSAITKSILTTCPAQDECPLSESLTEFLKDGHKLDHSQNLFLESACDDTDFMSKSQVCDCYNKNKTAAIKAGEDEQSEGSIFNCSADLFSNSPSMDMNSVALRRSQPVQDMQVQASFILEL
uniref:Replication factor A C-terminal domain-containing protein n=1 Tax=Neogobius melanostomus TaxID=47308 RepID=A0A8C6SFR8_9GOBI